MLNPTHQREKKEKKHWRMSLNFQRYNSSVIKQEEKKRKTNLIRQPSINLTPKLHCHKEDLK